MCGIAGIARSEARGVSAQTLWAMAAVLNHRGPDDSAITVGERVGLAHTRLSIIDLEAGRQPMLDPSARFAIVYNGEVYNYLELRTELAAKGYQLRTRSDTEVVVTAFAEWGEQALSRFNGQFAFAIHDRRDDSIFLARDRFGVRPLVYSIQRGTLVFGSEAKALFASGEVEPVPDLEGLDEVFSCWAARAPRTLFRGVHALPPGCCAHWRNGELRSKRWFEPDYGEDPTDGRVLVEELDQLLKRSVAYRVRSDVPVGAYLSGGIDSSVTASLAAGVTPSGLHTFSVTFEDPTFNEARFQKEVAAGIGSQHHARLITGDDIAAVFPAVIRHTETPLLRTAAAPMLLLAEHVRAHSTKVVLTGEGADELFLGYDLFREAAVRRFCLRGGNSAWRARLFDRIYPYMRNDGRGDLWQKWFLAAGNPDDALFSHLPRFLLAARTKDFYSAAAADQLRHVDVLGRLRDSLPNGFTSWSSANRAAFLELTTLLEPYLLSSQGDRMSLAHGVEGRYPFLDHELFRWTTKLPVTAKLRGLRDKRILRQWATGRLPRTIAARPKQPYRAPDAAAFFGGTAAPEYVRELLDVPAIKDAGYFDPAAVQGLARRCLARRVTSTRENQALVAILSTQLWHHTFFTRELRNEARPISNKQTEPMVSP